MKGLLGLTGATGVLYYSNHPLFVRREPDPGKDKEVALSSGSRRLVKSLTCASLLLASAAVIADNPPVPTQIVDLANKVDGVHPGFRAFHAKALWWKAASRPRRKLRGSAAQRYSTAAQFR
jgi:hypothetical protein